MYPPAAASWLLLLHIGCATLAAGHALLSKPDPRSAFGWIVVCWLFPLGGPILYGLFGINRVRARARELRTAAPAIRIPAAPHPAEDFDTQLARIGDAVTHRPRVAGNEVELLENGENAFPVMLEAIANAHESVWLATYIFDTDAVGQQFITALAAAAARGVQVRVLVDGVGGWYSWPRATKALRSKGVPAASFLGPRLFPPRLTLNLRNHRKLLIVDGSVAFLGGMNIGARELGKGTGHRMADLHFQTRGPIVEQLGEAFVVDWEFSAREKLNSRQPQSSTGNCLCRVITEGPDEDADKLLSIILGAICVARRQILIMTPYFIPSPELTGALQVAALRGVDVCIILPEHSNLLYVDWASHRWLPPLLGRGVKIYLQPSPFSHTKLLVVDEVYAHVGSANLDPRSLRLNFEIAMEVYSAEVCKELSRYVAAARDKSTRYTAEAAARQSTWVRVRNSLFWLLSPYL
jgi:cardiolipin synthase